MRLHADFLFWPGGKSGMRFAVFVQEKDRRLIENVVLPIKVEVL
jgi:hypothetical protein